MATNGNKVITVYDLIEYLKLLPNYKLYINTTGSDNMNDWYNLEEFDLITKIATIKTLINTVEQSSNDENYVVISLEG